MKLISEWVRCEGNPSEPRPHKVDYDLLSRVHLVGVIDLGWAKFRFGELPPKHKHEPRASVLRFCEREFDFNEYKKSAKNGRYHMPGGAAQEFSVLITLFTRVHFVISRYSETESLSLVQNFNPPPPASTDYEGQDLALKKVNTYFLMLRKLYEIDQTNGTNKAISFLMAARFYHLAHSTMSVDRDLAYLCLCSAIECLSEAYDVGEIDISEVQPNTAKALDELALDSRAKQKILDALFKDNRFKIAKRFENFICDHVTQDFWNDQTRPSNVYARWGNPQELRRAVHNIYKARSRALHKGESFPPAMPGVERDLGLAVTTPTGHWEEAEFVPHVSAFERLVHHVLVEYLRKETGSSGVATN